MSLISSAAAAATVFVLCDCFLFAGSSTRQSNLKCIFGISPNQPMMANIITVVLGDLLINVLYDVFTTTIVLTKNHQQQNVTNLLLLSEINIERVIRKRERELKK